MEPPGQADGANARGSALSISVKRAADGFSGPLSPPRPIPGVPNPVEKGLAGPAAAPPGIGKRWRFYRRRETEAKNKPEKKKKRENEPVSVELKCSNRPGGCGGDRGSEVAPTPGGPRSVEAAAVKYQP